MAAEVVLDVSQRVPLQTQSQLVHLLCEVSQPILLLLQTLGLVVVLLVSQGGPRPTLKASHVSQGVPPEVAQAPPDCFPLASRPN